MHDYITRWHAATIEQHRQTYRVLTLMGPNQCGKTALCTQLASPQVEFRTLDDVKTLNLAQADFREFVRHGNDLLVIDEVQRVPDLALAVKQAVDRNNRPGQFLLTGAANVPTLPQVKEDLAGRTSLIRLRTLSHGEVIGAQPSFLERAFAQNFPDSSSAPGISQAKLIELALRGGYPGVLNLPNKDRQRWHRHYIEALIARDLRDMTNLHRHAVMQDLIFLAAVWSSKHLNQSRLARQLEIKRDTLREYLGHLKMLFLVDQLPPWTKTDYSKVGRRKKLFVTDSGLMAPSCWGMQAEPSSLDDADALDKLIKTWVYNELAAQLELDSHKYFMYHYHDNNQRSVDFIIETRGDQNLLGIKVKAATSFSQSDLKHLRWFRDNLAGQREFTGILLYAGSTAELDGREPVGGAVQPPLGIANLPDAANLKHSARLQVCPG